MKTLRFDSPVEIQAAGDGSTKLPTFSILGYTGAPMNVAGFYTPVVIDLAGHRAAGSEIPALRDHDPNRIVGQADSIKIGADVRLAGTITGENADATEVVTQSRNGFKWRASVGADIVRREFLEAGKRAKVNGREVVGPILIARESILQEISFVAIGADGKTSANVTAKKGEDMSLSIEHSTDGASIATAERERVKAIMAACGPDQAEIQAKAIDGGWTIEATKAALYDRTSNADALGTLRGERPGGSFGVVRGRSSVEAVAPGGPDRIVAAAMLLGGHGETLARMPGGERLANSVPRPNGWADLCAMALRAEGLPVPHDRGEMIRAAFSTTSLPTVVGSTVQKIALDLFREATAGVLAVSRVIPATDFKGGKAIRLASAGKLEPIGRDGMIKYGSLGEDAYDYTIGTLARMYGVTRQDIINDDASILSDIPIVLGNESARTLNDIFSTALIAGSASFFSTGNKNYFSGSTTNLSVDSLSTAVKMLRTQVDGDGRIIGMTPAVLTVPAALEATGRQILSGMALSRDASKDNVSTANPWGDSNITLAVEPRLDADSTTAWYLFSNPMHGAVLLALLDGMLGAKVETSPAPFDQLGQQWRAYLDCGVKLAETRAVVKSKGAA